MGMPFDKFTVRFTPEERAETEAHAQTMAWVTGCARAPGPLCHRCWFGCPKYNFGSAARTRATGNPSSRRTIFVPSTSDTHL